jgi:hypothetical protein
MPDLGFGGIFGGLILVYKRTTHSQRLPGKMAPQPRSVRRVDWRASIEKTLERDGSVQLAASNGPANKAANAMGLTLVSTDRPFIGEGAQHTYRRL